MAESKTGAVKLTLTPDLFNSLISVLNTYVNAYASHDLSKEAQLIIDKCMNYGREYVHENETYIEINFYPTDASMLMKLFIIYDSAIEKPDKNFYEIFHMNKLMKINK